MTNDAIRQELEKLKEDKEAEIKSLKLQIKNIELELSNIKGRIFQIINAEFPAQHISSPIKLPNERKNSF